MLIEQWRRTILFGGEVLPSANTVLLIFMDNPVVTLFNAIMTLIAMKPMLIHLILRVVCQEDYLQFKLEIWIQCVLFGEA